MKSGLINHGNTCYLNAAIQSLFHTKLLTEYLLTEYLINENSIQSELGNIKNKINYENRVNQSLIDSYISLLIDNIKSEKKEKSLDSRKILKYLILKNRRFSINRQHDTAEALTYILDSFENYLPLNLFSGELSSTITRSKYSSTQYEKFTYLSFEIPSSEIPSSEIPLSEIPLSEIPLSEIPSFEIPSFEIPSFEIPLFEIIPFDFFSSINEDLSIYSCLDSFTKTEILEDTTQKNLKFSKLPKCLIIQLKRFYCSTSDNQTYKNNRLVRYPSVINLQKYCTENSSSNYQYSLYSIINHTGNLDFGHYFAFCKVQIKNNDQWFYFNDTEVTEIDENKVFDQKSAYLFFYASK